MESGLLLPIKAKYEGLDADGHLIDAIYLGKSIEGTAKLYNQALYLFEHGKVPSARSQYRVKLYASCPKEGSVSLAFHSLMAGSEMAIYPELWGKMAGWIIPSLIKSTWQHLLNKPNATRQIIDAIQEEAQRNREFAKDITQMSINAILEDKARLHDTIEILAKRNKKTAKLIVEPVGRTCSLLTQTINGQSIVEIDEPAAEVIRSQEDLEVTELENYRCKIEGVNKVNGSCWIKFPDNQNAISGKIVDPQLLVTGNIYTHALDQSLDVIIQAKALVAEGKIKKLFISDAKIIK